MSNTVYVGTRPENQRRGKLAPVVQGSTESVHTITVAYANGDAYDLSDMTLSGAWWRARDNSEVFAITGTLTVTDAENGVFEWDHSAADVAYADVMYVQFIITNDSDQEIDATFPAQMTVESREGVTNQVPGEEIDGGSATTVATTSINGGDAEGE